MVKRVKGQKNRMSKAEVERQGDKTRTRKEKVREGNRGVTHYDERGDIL